MSLHIGLGRSLRTGRPRHGRKDAHVLGISEQKDCCDALIPELQLCSSSDLGSYRLRLFPQIHCWNAVEREYSREMHLFPGAKKHVLVRVDLWALQQLPPGTVVPES